MAYVIATEKTMYPAKIPSGDVFWSYVYGLFSNLRSAVKYDSLEAAQPTVGWLRTQCPNLFIYAIEQAL